MLTQLSSGVLNGISYVVVGEDGPVTLFCHGLGGSVSEIRPLSAKVAGTRVLMDFRGHGDSDDLENGWDYDDLANDLLMIADSVGASQAVGMSLGSGALLRALSRDPSRFARVAFVLPATIDDNTPRDGAEERFELLGSAILAQDARAAADVLLAELPPEVRARRGIDALVLRRSTKLVSRPAPAPRSIDRPVHDRSVLGVMTAPALVMGQLADRLHPVALAAELAAGLPNATLVTLPAGGVFWTAGGAAQAALADHLVED